MSVSCTSSSPRGFDGGTGGVGGGGGAVGRLVRTNFIPEAHTSRCSFLDAKLAVDGKDLTLGHQTR